MSDTQKDPSVCMAEIMQEIERPMYRDAVKGYMLSKVDRKASLREVIDGFFSPQITSRQAGMQIGLLEQGISWGIDMLQKHGFIKPRKRHTKRIDNPKKRK